ncbi:hypothetical protein PSENEW3n2_00002244 [Picochlorum sp. SENEW3]|nr:hypothetical protein PSENEW3n2_00002244 [Picochlorum sp. SENEW3]WPT15881.1 hypothetical protein PSENEW3_00002244 [Picochlorum sp. SENEW3]
MTLLNRTFVVCALVATLSLSVSAERALHQTDLSDLGSEISAQVNEEVAKAQEEMARKCGPDANSISGDTCYGKCSGSLVIDNSECTCNGEPCVSWKVGETGPSTTSTTPSTGSATGVSEVIQASGVRAVSVVSALLACIVALLL